MAKLERGVEIVKGGCRNKGPLILYIVLLKK